MWHICVSFYASSAALTTWYFTQKQHFCDYFMSSTPVSRISYKIFMSDFDFQKLLVIVSSIKFHENLSK